MLTNEALSEFKELWKTEFGEEISDEKAMKEAINLLTLMNAVYKPIRKDWSEN